MTIPLNHPDNFDYDPSHLNLNVQTGAWIDTCNKPNCAETPFEHMLTVFANIFNSCEDTQIQIGINEINKRGDLDQLRAEGINPELIIDSIVELGRVHTMMKIIAALHLNGEISDLLSFWHRHMVQDNNGSTDLEVEFNGAVDALRLFLRLSPAAKG